MRVLNNKNFFMNSNIFTQTTCDGDFFQHKHNFYEFFYIINGEISHKYNGRAPIKLSTGDFCVVPPNIEHCFLRKKDNSCSHRDILINNDLIAECCNFLSPKTLSILNNTENCVIGHLSNSEIQLLEKEMNKHTLYRNQLFTNDYGYEKIFCFNIIKHVNQLTLNTINNYPTWFNQLLTSFQNTAKIKGGLNKILENCFFSKPYLCKSFKKYTGLTMTDYLLQARLLYASSLLKYTDMTITNIVSETGISSIPYFNKKFKEVFGVTPSQYKKNNN